MFPSLLGALGLAFTTDKHSYAVGDAPIYRITGAVPGSVIAWTSYKNGQPTGEYNANYGQTVDANGTAELTGGAWTDADKGQWQKELVVIAPDGTISNATISFSVTGAAAANPAPTQQAGALDGTVNLPVIGEVPVVGALIGGAALAYLIFKRR